jgi:hypothetical protein
MDRVIFNRKLEDFRAGQICSIFAATVPHDGRPLRPDDFFPGLRVKQQLSAAKVRAVFRAAQATQE